MHSWTVRAWTVHSWTVHAWTVHAWTVHSWITCAWAMHPGPCNLSCAHLDRATSTVHIWTTHPWTMHPKRATREDGRCPRKATLCTALPPERRTSTSRPRAPTQPARVHPCPHVRRRQAAEPAGLPGQAENAALSAPPSWQRRRQAARPCLHQRFCHLRRGHGAGKHPQAFFSPR